MKNDRLQKEKKRWTNWVYWCIVPLATILRKQRWVYLSQSGMPVKSIQSGSGQVEVHIKTLSPLQN